jgi:hypothetical protein
MVTCYKQLYFCGESEMKSKTLCWQCGHPLELDKQGELKYSDYTDPIGNVHKVHIYCMPYTERQLTANYQQLDLDFAQRHCLED